MKRLVLFLAAAVAALLVAVPAMSATGAASIRAAGTVKAFQTAGPIAKFTLYLDSTLKSNKLVYREPGTTFKALTMTNTLFSSNAARFGGIGLVNGKRVHYTAVVVAHPTYAGVFRLAWNHGASRGGSLLDGNVNFVNKTSNPGA
jgi:hypothetical protein